MRGESTTTANIASVSGLLKLFRDSFQWRSLPGDLPYFRGLLVSVAYYLGVRVGLALTFQPHPVSVMWPPNSILTAALVLSPARWWCFLLLCVLPTHLLPQLADGIPASMSLCWFISNCSEALIGAAGVRAFAGASARFDKLRNVGVLLLCCGLLGPVISSFLDAAFVGLNQFGQEDYWRVWRMRTSSNMFTAITLVPAIVLWRSVPILPPHRFNTRGMAELCLVCAGLLGVSMAALWSPIGSGTLPLGLYATVPFLLYAAIRFGPTATSTCSFAVALLAIWSAAHGRGPFHLQTAEKSAVIIQVFFILVSSMFLVFAVANREKREAEQRFEKLFRWSPDAIVVSHRETGRILEVNEKWGQIFGYTASESIGRRAAEVGIYAAASDQNKLVRATLQDQPVRDLELNLRTKDGRIVRAQISADTLDMGAERCLVTIIRDMRDRQRAEEAQHKLLHVSRLAVMGEMTAMMAHEVNQPLGAILSNADAADIILSSGKADPATLREILSDIRKDDLRADAAIRRIRALFKKQDFRLESLDLNESVREAMRFAQGNAARSNISLRMQLQENLSPVLADHSQIQQVLLNLILNGIEAMMQTPDNERRLTVSTERKERCVEVSVVDNGPGVPADRFSEIFESFFTTKKEGMGLGLSIARTIIEAHRGRIWVDNNSSGGAAFHFRLPEA